MTQELLIAGGGIAGLAAAVAATRAGWSARVFEQAQAFSEVGAGVQLGPNVTRILREWGLLDGVLADRVARPVRLVVRDAVDGAQLGTLALADFDSRYGAPYVTVHRADLHAALVDAARGAAAHLRTAHAVLSVRESASGVLVKCGDGPEVEGDALAGADGLWSQIRSHLGDVSLPRYTGHLAYRALLPMDSVPSEMRVNEVTAWLGPDMHLVTYPVRGGESLNIVCVVEGPLPPGDAHSWDHEGVRAQLLASLGEVCAAARDRIEAVPAWRLWPLHGRAPVSGADLMARGRVALVGDAAHPMLPYLAQGAGMAIEDARELERVLAVVDGRTIDVPTALSRYALNRWQRCARVQARSLRNATVFHASGALRVARNVSMRIGGERLMDVPWLYNH
jgi:salicylate hydroxylase